MCLSGWCKCSNVTGVYTKKMLWTIWLKMVVKYSYAKMLMEIRS